MISDEMTFRDINDLWHFVHATHTSTIETLCGRKSSYLPFELSDSWNNAPTCFWCVLPTIRWMRPPFDRNDVRYRDAIVRALST